MIVHDSWWSNGSARSTIIDYYETFDQYTPHKQIVLSCTLIGYNHGQRYWDKFTCLALFHTRIHPHLVSSSSVQCWTRAHVISPELQHCIWGEGGGGGGEATHLETDNSAFLKLHFKNRKFMQLHKCPKEFCPPFTNYRSSPSSRRKTKMASRFAWFPKRNFFQ